MQVLETVLALPDLEMIGRRNYQRRGIFPSEMAAVIALCRAEKIDVLIESGRARGHSTVLVAEFLPQTEVHSFELKRDQDAEIAEKAAAPFQNLHLHYGNAMWRLPLFARKFKGQRVAVLIDGPKDIKAVELMTECMLEDNVSLGFVHDLYRSPSHSMAARELAEHRFSNNFFTDDPAYVAALRYLDAPVFETKDAGWEPYTMAGRPTLSYGPTLGCFVFSTEDRAKARLSRSPRARARKALARMLGPLSP